MIAANVAHEEGAMTRQFDIMIHNAAALEAASAAMRRNNDARTRHVLDPTVPLVAAVTIVVLLYLASRAGANVAEEFARWVYALSQILGL